MIRSPQSTGKRAYVIFASCYCPMNIPRSRPQPSHEIPSTCPTLAQVNDAGAADVARALVVRYPVAAMALLRFVRQGLVDRSREHGRAVYRYRLSLRGRARLRYLQERS